MMKKITANGLEFSVQIEGQGPDVLLVHGFPDCHEVWRKQVPALVAAGFRVIVPDLRGCGESDMPGKVSDYKLEKLVGDLVALLHALDVKKVRLVGHDWGAVLAWQLCLHHPQLVDRYVALSVGHPNAYSQGGLAQKLRGYYILLFQLRGFSEWLCRVYGGGVFRRLLGDHPEFTHWHRRLWRPGRLTAAINWYRANVWLILKNDWPRCLVPTLGVWSDGDLFLVERQMTASRGQMAAEWRYEQVTGASHWLQLDQPDRVNRLILDYLA